MILALLIFLFNPVISKFEDESSCLEQIKCPTTEAPICIRVKQRNQNVMDMVLFNQCELEYKKCYEGTDAVAVPMKNCHYANDTGYLHTKTMRKNRSKRQANIDYLPSRVVKDNRKRQLSFFIDGTLEMAVKGNLKDVVKLIAEEAVKFYDTTFLAGSFGGDEPINADQTADIDEFIDMFNKMADMVVGVNDPCNKEILDNIRMALPDGGYLYVFTCGFAKDYQDSRNWKNGNVKVTFILWPHCYGNRKPRDNPGFQVFFDIAAKTGGQVIRVPKGHDIKQLLKYVRHTALEFDSQILMTQIQDQGAYLPVKVERADFVLISASGSQVDFAITTGDWKNKIQRSSIFNAAHTKVYRFLAYYDFYLVQLDTSTYKHGKLNVSMNVMSSRVDFTFQYRFSSQKKWRNGLRNEPLDGRKGASKKFKYLIIYVTEKRKWVEVNKIKFIELDEHDNEVVFESHKLVKIAEDTYATESKIAIPTYDFFMVASGVIKENGVIKEVDSQEIKYKASEHKYDESSEPKDPSKSQEFTNSNDYSKTEDYSKSEDSSELVRPTTEPTEFKIRPTSAATKHTMWPEALLFEREKEGNNKKKLSWKQFQSSCPSQCPARGVFVCARCQHGVHRTFLSDCHIRMYQCGHPGDKLYLVARKPCIGIAPYLGDLPRPVESLNEPEDVVISHIYAKKVNAQHV